MMTLTVVMPLRLGLAKLIKVVIKTISSWMKTLKIHLEETNQVEGKEMQKDKNML